MRGEFVRRSFRYPVKNNQPVMKNMRARRSEYPVLERISTGARNYAQILDDIAGRHRSEQSQRLSPVAGR